MFINKLLWCREGFSKQNFAYYLNYSSHFKKLEGRSEFSKLKSANLVATC
jgi:hypothetical protein